MNRGLTYLLRKKPAGWARVVQRRFRTAKGVLLGFGMLAFAVLLIGPQIWQMTQRTAETMTTAAAALRLWGPPALMLLALLGMSSGVGLHFRQSEIDFLFPAPIGRRELLLYHVLGRLMVAVLSALWLAIFVLRWAPQWYAGLVGIFFGLAFLQLIAGSTARKVWGDLAPRGRPRSSARAACLWSLHHSGRGRRSTESLRHAKTWRSGGSPRSWRRWRCRPSRCGSRAASGG